MTRLFFRFYLAVLFVLFSAAVVQNIITQRQNDSHNVEVVEAALSGGVRLARDTFSAFPQIERQELLQVVQSRFAYPVRIMPVSDVPDYVASRLAAGSDVVFHLDQTTRKGMLKTSLAGTNEVLSFGPLPEFAGPSQLDLIIGVIVVLAVAALAIALLLRPMASQFRLIEHTAMAIAGGDFSARVDEAKVTSTKALAQAFNNMAGRTETLLRTQRELLQAVSHELRTPLSRIHFAVDLIRTSATVEEREQRLQSVTDAVEDLDLLVGELLSYVRLESNVPDLQLSDVELLPLVQELIRKTSLMYPEKSFELGPELANSNVVVQGERTSLERALSNLLNNAGRHARSQVVINAVADAGQVSVCVDDDGPGIPVADRQRIFEPFVRLSEDGSGAGLGLALVQRIARVHGGAVAASDNALGGCRISLNGLKGV